MTDIFLFTGTGMCKALCPLPDSVKVYPAMYIMIRDIHDVCG